MNATYFVYFLWPQMYVCIMVCVVEGVGAIGGVVCVKCRGIAKQLASNNEGCSGTIHLGILTS